MEAAVEQTRRLPLGTTLVVGVGVLAVVGQLLHLAQWPVYVLGDPVDPVPARFLALVRLSFYLTMVWGLIRREPTAWAMAVFELYRSFLMFLILLVGRTDSLRGALYPATWAQGLSASGLPMVYGLNAATYHGWRAGLSLELAVLLGVLLLSAGLAQLGTSLFREAEAMGVEPGRRWHWLLRGLPFSATLLLLELVARHLAHPAATPAT